RRDRRLGDSTPPRFELLAPRLHVGKHFPAPLFFGAPLLLRALCNPLGFFLLSSPRGLLLASPFRGRELLLRDLRLGLQSMMAKGILQYRSRFCLIFRQGNERGLVQGKIDKRNGKGGRRL
ncbi:unnamed protein product, partial [Ectocarpus fasciculatus]